MKALKKISYSPDVDILMIHLSNKKIDDAYDANDMIIQVDKNGEPVVIEMFNGKKHLKELGESLPKDIQKELSGRFISVPHRIRK